MVIPDPARQGTAVQRTIQQRIQALPDAIAGELRQWVQVVRGEGRREHRELPFATIRSYLNCFYPVLAAWTERITSLREITRDDIRAALDERPPVTARNLLPALRSLFRALRQERIIFRDPTRGITLPAMRRLPVPIPTDQLRGLIDRADGPMAKLIVTLIAIHGLGKKETTRLLIDDLNLSSRPPPRPAEHRTAHRLPRRAHPHPRDRLAQRTAPALAPHRQPPPAGHQADRRRRRQTRRSPSPSSTPSSGSSASAPQSCARTGSWTRPSTPPTPSISCASSASQPNPPCTTSRRPIPNAARGDLTRTRPAPCPKATTTFGFRMRRQPGIDEPARFRLLHHAVVVAMKGTQTVFGRTVTLTALPHFRWWLDVVMCHDQSWLT